VDIEPMKSPLSKTPPNYSLVMYQGDQLIFKQSDVKKSKVIEYLNKYNITILAIDNIFELVKDNQELYQLIKKLPVGMKIIQVTGNPANPQTLKPLKIVAQQNGIKLNFSNPQESAQACVELVKKKVGYAVRLFKDETKIIISPSKIPGRGGQSTNRYKRNLTGRILNMSREIQNILEKSNLDYDLSVRKSEFGLDWAHFLVYSSYESVYKRIKPVFTPKIKIKIEPIKRKQVEYVPLKGKLDKLTKQRSLIVGLDPGTTIGLAILDLNGNLIYLISQKNMSRNDLRELLYYNYGIPSIVGTDVPKIPRFVEKFANSTNALIYHPHKTLKVAEKIEIVDRYMGTQKSNLKVEDAHQRDSLVSAIKAYQFFEKRFKKVVSKVREMNLGFDIDIEEVKNYIIKGHSIFDSISLASPSLPEEKEEKDVEGSSIFTKIEEMEKKLRIFTKKIDRLQNKNTMLMNKIQGYRYKIKQIKKENRKIKELEKRIENLKDKEYKELRKERTIASLDKEISSLKRQINKRDHEIKILKSDIEEFNKKATFIEELNLTDKFYNLKIIPNFSMEELRKVAESDENDIVLFANPSGGGPNTALELVKKGVRCVIYETNISKNLPYGALKVFIENNIICIPADEFKIFKFDQYKEYALINKKEFEKIYKQWKKKREKELLREKEKQLSNILANYREERKKETR
jgi:hypothetical protein